MRYATAEAWAQHFEIDAEVMITRSAIGHRLRKAGIKGIPSRGVTGVVTNHYSEADIRKILADLFIKCPMCDEDGFFEKDGKHYASINTWVDTLKISKRKLKNRLRRAGKKGATARYPSGRIFINSFFSEEDVYEVYGDKLAPYPKCNKDGFFEKDGKRYATLEIWQVKIDLCRMTIRKKLKEIGIVGITGKSNHGHVYKNAYFSEDDIRKACPPQCGI